MNKLASQAEYEGSIPFTRSTLLRKGLSRIGRTFKANVFTRVFTGWVPQAFAYTLLSWLLYPFPGLRYECQIRAMNWKWRRG